MSATTDNFASFADFYPYYLQEHRQASCRALHYLGSSLVLVVAGFAILTGQWHLLWWMPVAGYGFAWVGHYFIEHNKPATFRHPFYSLLGDWVMFWHFISGQLDEQLSRAHASQSKQV